jgi:hypothetical protein
MSSMMKILIFYSITILSAFGCGTPSVDKQEVVRFAPGQIWHYDTRPGEEGSTLTILRVDSFPEDGKVVHIRLDHINVINPNIPTGVSTEAEHLPMKWASLDSSVTTLVSEGNTVPPFTDGYKLWRTQYDKDSAGVFNVNVKVTVQYLEEAMSNSIRVEQ